MSINDDTAEGVRGEIPLGLDHSSQAALIDESHELLHEMLENSDGLYTDDAVALAYLITALHRLLIIPDAKVELADIVLDIAEDTSVDDENIAAALQRVAHPHTRTPANPLPLAHFPDRRTATSVDGVEGDRGEPCFAEQTDLLMRVDAQPFPVRGTLGNLRENLCPGDGSGLR